MKLSKIEITNFRCFESVSLSLKPDVNVIVGINGAGKTTILDAIAIALIDIIGSNGYVGRKMLQVTDIHVDPTSKEESIGRRNFMQLRVVVQDFYPLENFPSYSPHKPPPVLLEWSRRIDYHPPSGLGYGCGVGKDAVSIADYYKALWQEIQKAGPEALIPLPVIAYYRATRAIAAMPDLGEVFRKKLERKDAFQNALNAGADYQALCQWFYLRENNEVRDRLIHRDTPDFQYPDLQAVRSAVSTVIGNVKRIYFEGTPPSLRVELTDPHDGLSSFEIEQLSDGYRNLLALVMDFARRLAQAHPNWLNPLEAPGILLIDEIELHLHPGWQQTVIPNLRAAFPNTQIIAATHSPEVLTTVRRENIHLLGADHGIETLPADVGTFGAESSRVLQEVFSVPSRPRILGISQQLDEYLALVESRQQDTERGRELRATLENALGQSDPDLHLADARISQIKALGGR